jgi:hypothetical protein
MDVDEAWLYMIMKFVDKIICDWVVIYWIGNCNDKWMLIKTGLCYGYGMLMKIYIDDWVCELLN